MKEILVPLDGSKFGESVIPVALALAGLEGGRVHLVHVEEPRPLVGGRIEEPSALELGDAYVAALKARIREEAGDGRSCPVCSGGASSRPSSDTRGTRRSI